MDFKQIQELIKIINKSNIGEIIIEDNDFKIKMGKATVTEALLQATKLI